jgi:hypothetical protein
LLKRKNQGATIVEVVTEVIVVDSVADTLVILKSVAKVADALEIAREKNLFAHSVAQHQRSQSMKIVQRAQIVRLVLNVQFAQIETINLKSAESQNAHLELTAIPKLNVLKNQIAQQRQIA